jgi:hypothetical protein
LTKDSFLGLKVRWRVVFVDLKGLSDAERAFSKLQTIYELSARFSERCGVRARVDIARFPRLKILHEDTPIQIAGEINYVSDDGRITRLKEAVVTFDDFGPVHNEPTRTASELGFLRDGKIKEGISEIRFDYLPERTPEEEGWELVMDQGPNRPRFELRSNPVSADKSLRVVGTGYRLDWSRELPERCRTVQYSADLEDNDASLIYAQVRMGSREGRPDKDGWIAHKFDTTRNAIKLNEGEWTLTDPGTQLVNSRWRLFTWSLAEEVERTFGADRKWFYKRLLRIRLRGPLSITPIRLLEGGQ